MNVTADGEMNATVRAVNVIFEKPIEFKRKYATSNVSNTTNTTIDLETICHEPMLVFPLIAVNIALNYRRRHFHCSGLEDEANAEFNKSSLI